MTSIRRQLLLWLLSGLMLGVAAAGVRIYQQTLEAGQIAEMVGTADKGYLVYGQSKKEPDLSPSSSQYAAARAQLMLYISASNQNSFLGELVTRELEKTETSTRQAQAQ